MNNFKIALRHLKRNKTYALVSILGLAVGISCCKLIALNVFHELSFDQYHNKKDRIYKINATLNFNGVIESALTSLAVGPTVKDEFPEVESYVRFRNYGQAITVTYQDKVFSESKIALTDSTVFSIFDIELIKGDPNTALSAPNSFVISEAFAEKYQIRRVTTSEAFYQTCSEFLDNDEPVPTLPPERSKLFCGFNALRS